MTMVEENDGLDLFEGPSDVQIFQSLLEDLENDVGPRVARYRQLIDMSAALGENGTMFPGGTASFYAWVEARSSFVSGNFIATILLCQATAENVLAGMLHAFHEDVPPKVQFSYTLTRCEALGIVENSQIEGLKKLASLRNPLSHFRSVSDGQNLTRRAMAGDELAEDILAHDAHFAMTTVVSLLSSSPFRVDRSSGLRG